MADEDRDGFSFCIRFNTAEMRRLNQTSRTCGRNSAADSDVEFLSNLISKIEFDTAEMRRVNQA